MFYLSLVKEINIVQTCDFARIYIGQSEAKEGVQQSGEQTERPGSLREGEIQELVSTTEGQKSRESKIGPICTGKGCEEEKEDIFKSEALIIVC